MSVLLAALGALWGALVALVFIAEVRRHARALTSGARCWPMRRVLSRVLVTAAALAVVALVSRTAAPFAPLGFILARYPLIRRWGGIT